MANEYFREHVAYIIATNEGSTQTVNGKTQLKYDMVELGTPYMGIGVMQWSWGESFDVIRDTYVAGGNSWLGTTPPNDIKTAVENNNRWSEYKFYQSTPATTWVRKFLITKECMAIQNKRYFDDVDNFIAKQTKQGVTDLRAKGYCCDVANQYGTGYGRVWGGGRYNGTNASTLKKAHSITPQKYASRRNRTYKYFLDADFDKPSPIDFDLDTTIPVEDEDIAGGDIPFELPEFIDENFGNLIDKVFRIVTNSHVTKMGNIYYNKYIKVIPETGYTNNKLSYLINTTTDFTKIWEELVKQAQKDYDETEKANEDGMEEEIEEIESGGTGSVSNAIQKAIDKALSYPDGSVPYSMDPPKDMKKSGDCSTFVKLCYQAAGISIGDWTGDQYKYANKKGKVIVNGGRSIIPEILDKVKAGDYVLMGFYAGGYVAGGKAHVGIMVSKNGFRHQSQGSGLTGVRGRGPYTDPLDRYLNEWVKDYKRFSLCRPLN